MRALACIALTFAMSGAASAQETATYTYDVHGRLVEVERSSGADTSYTYDDADNRTSKVTAGASLLMQQGGSANEGVITPATDDQDEDSEGEENPPQR